MQVKKEILLFMGLIVLSASLLIASSDKGQVGNRIIPASPPVKCCQKQPKPASPWNFITGGILHLTA